LSKILVWDLETSDLKANRGHILCAAAKWAESDDIYSWNINRIEGYGETPKSFQNDKEIVEDLVEMMEEADATVAHYGKRFDLRFLNTRAIVHGLEIPPPVKLIDTWKYARDSLALHSNRLESIARLLGTENQKYHLPLEAWMLAQYGDKKILDQMEEYCINDVLTVEDVYLKLRPIIPDHPYAVEGKLDDCPACGSKRIQRRGHRRTKMYKIERFHCQECGNWFNGKQQRVK
jgi:DNA polymerase III epsilon subunit-like protein